MYVHGGFKKTNPKHEVNLNETILTQFKQL